MILVLAALIAVFLAGAVCGIFAILVVGIHAEERRAIQQADSAPSLTGRASRRLLSAESRDDVPTRVKAGR